MNLQDRAKEEIQIVQNEMRQTLRTVADQHSTQRDSLAYLSDQESMRNRGATILLKLDILRNEERFVLLSKKFADYVEAPPFTPLPILCDSPNVMIDNNEIEDPCMSEEGFCSDESES